MRPDRISRTPISEFQRPACHVCCAPPLACFRLGFRQDSNSQQFRREIEVQADIRQSEDALEGRNAFVEKRATRFSGR